eukprot:Lithocolla_globosa_v1_NODE_1210_length_2782_cov_63.330766.p2 type:complete len:136 gc:universal NODE_1210_length_2782_cov_63.330766:1042-1449(+)
MYKLLMQVLTLMIFLTTFFGWISNTQMERSISPGTKSSFPHLLTCKTTLLPKSARWSPLLILILRRKAAIISMMKHLLSVCMSKMIKMPISRAGVGLVTQVGLILPTQLLASIGTPNSLWTTMSDLQLTCIHGTT